RYGAGLAGVEVSDLDRSMQEFAKRIGEAVAKGGELERVLSANGVAIRDVNGNVRPTMELLREFANLIKHAGSEQERLYLAQLAFGRAGATMVNALKDGAQAIDTMADAAGEAGAVIEDELIRKAEEVDDEFAALQTRMTTFAKREAVIFIDQLSNIGDELRAFRDNLIGAWEAFDGFWNSITGRDPTSIAMDKLRTRLNAAKVDGDYGEGFSLQDMDFGPAAPKSDRLGSPPRRTIVNVPKDDAGGGGRGARRGGGGGGGGRSPMDEARQRLDAYAAILAGGRQFIAQQEMEQQAIGKTAEEAARLRHAHDMLQQAERAGIALGPQQRAELDALAASMAKIEAATIAAAEAQERAVELQQFLGEEFTSLFGGILSGAMTAEEAVSRLLSSLIDAALQAAFLGKGPFGGMFGGVGILTKLFGFAEGGYTGDGGKYQPAGVVHRGEYVFDKAATSRIGVANLEAIRSGELPGYSGGGFVGSEAGANVARLLHAGNDNSGVPPVMISAPITVNGSAGTPEQNADLARRMRKEMEATMRGVVADEMRRQTRPGNFANSRSR
ncbi:hypothetical protein PZ895_00460, partial [Mesorhizobium sp. YIM 152430]|nr:hypothetical protein [Mesorhizobium sp. YIM 152430]